MASEMTGCVGEPLRLACIFKVPPDLSQQDTAHVSKHRQVAVLWPGSPDVSTSAGIPDG